MHHGLRFASTTRQTLHLRVSLQTAQRRSGQPPCQPDRHRIRRSPWFDKDKEPSIVRFPVAAGQRPSEAAAEPRSHWSTGHSCSASAPGRSRSMSVRSRPLHRRSRKHSLPDSRTCRIPCCSWRSLCGTHRHRRSCSPNCGRRSSGDVGGPLPHQMCSAPG